MEFGLCELGAGKDEAPMAVRRDGMARTLGEEAFSSMDDEVPKSSSERAGKGLALF